MKNYNEFCKAKNCPHYIQWEFWGDELYSCKLIGQSQNIETYPAECPFLVEIEEIKLEKPE